MIKKTCKNCGDKYTPDEDEAVETELCEECFLMLENSQQEEMYDFSDADNGL